MFSCTRGFHIGQQEGFSMVPVPSLVIQHMFASWLGLHAKLSYLYLTLTYGLHRTVLVIMGLFFPLFFIQLDAVVHGVDTKLAFYLVRHIHFPIIRMSTPHTDITYEKLSILNASSFLGRIGSSIASQSFGIFNCIVPVACFCGILVFGLFGVRTVAAFSIFSVLYGLATGACENSLTRFQYAYWQQFLRYRAFCTCRFGTGQGLHWDRVCHLFM